MRAKPFLKWAGGKRTSLEHIRKVYPAKIDRYIEPMMGGGAVFFDLLPERSVISDTNEELINAYKVVRNDVDGLISVLSSHESSGVGLPMEEHEVFYYNLRSANLSRLCPVERAARFIFLNRTCFNGLYRVNKSGAFNVPCGKYKNPTVCDVANLRACSKALQGTVIACADVVDVLSVAGKGDFVYIDPPYLKIASNSFTAYTPEGFGIAEHEQLALCFHKAVRRGAFVVESNTSLPWVKEKYKKYSIEMIPARRSISRDPSSRGLVLDCLIVSGKPVTCELCGKDSYRRARAKYCSVKCQKISAAKRSKAKLAEVVSLD